MANRPPYGRDPCRHEGCKAFGGVLSGYCRDHVGIAHPCRVDGCANRVAAYSKSGCCRDHKKEAINLPRRAPKPWAP